jgi:S1-C subfamily serine protease
VNEFDDLLGYIVQYTKVGQTVQIRILRDGQSQEIPLTLEARPTAG